MIVAAAAIVAVAGATAAPLATTTIDPAAILRAADAEGAAGDWARATALIASLDLARLDRANLAEARRLRGLAAFYAGDYAAADRELFAWLELDLDARLDPAVTPPEAVSFFESVRARHAAELRARRPRERSWVGLNLLPPLGQFQNGERTKGWILAGAGATLLALDVGSYAFLKHWCSETDETCDIGGDHSSAARVMRPINLISGGALIALYAYGVVDGFMHYHEPSHELVVAPVDGGAQVMLVGSF